MSTAVEQIKDKLDVVEVIGSYLKLEKAGQNYKARCPFHNEKTASFFVSPSRQSFYCFGCQAKGDIFSFVERIEGLDFRGALKNLADKAGIELEERGREDRDHKERLFETMEATAKYFEKNLRENEEAAAYLERRGLNNNSISKWRIGWAPAEWRSVSDFLLQKNFTKDEMLQCGIIKVTSKGYYDTFRGRIMFPIFDSASRVIAFSGRTLVNDDSTPKYLNSPETELFRKSEVLYGWNFAKEYVRNLDYAVLVEGQMDVVMAHQSGTKNAVASSGTALTLSHLEKTGKLSKRVVIAYDSDEAGRKAARRAGEMALALGMEVKIVSLPEGEDPASLALQSPEKWKEALKSSVELIDFALKEALEKSAGSPIKLAKEISASVVPYLASVENDIVKGEYVGRTAKFTKISEKSLWDEIAKVKIEKERDKGEGPARNKPWSEEQSLAGMIILGESNKTGDASGLREKLENVTSMKLEEILNEEERDRIIFETEIKLAGTDLKQAAKEIWERIERRYLERRLRAIAEELDSPGGDRESLKKEALEISNKLSSQKK